MKPTVVVAEDELITRVDLVEILEGAGYNVLGQAKDGLEAIDICRKYKPDIAIMDIKMPLLNGINATKTIKEEKIAKCIILLTAYSDDEYVRKAKELGVMSYIVKPFDEKTIIPAIEIAYSKQQEINQTLEELETTMKKLENRKYIERAKGILMEQHCLSEEKGYNLLRKYAMDKRMSIIEVSKIIVNSTKE